MIPRTYDRASAGTPRALGRVMNTTTVTPTWLATRTVLAMDLGARSVFLALWRTHVAASVRFGFVVTAEQHEELADFVARLVSYRGAHGTRIPNARLMCDLTAWIS